MVCDKPDYGLRLDANELRHALPEPGANRFAAHWDTSRITSGALEPAHAAFDLPWAKLLGKPGVCRWVSDDHWLPCLARTICPERIARICSSGRARRLPGRHDIRPHCALERQTGKLRQQLGVVGCAIGQHDPTFRKSVHSRRLALPPCHVSSSHRDAC